MVVCQIIGNHLNNVAGNFLRYPDYSRIFDCKYGGIKKQIEDYIAGLERRENQEA